MTPKDQLDADLARVGAAAFTAADYKPGETLHIVLFRLKPTVSDAERAEVTRRFLALGHECRRDGESYIRDIVGGVPNGGEGVERGFELGYVLRFASEGDRNYYAGEATVIDPAHAAFKSFVGPLLADGGVLVFDFASGRP